MQNYSFIKFSQISRGKCSPENDADSEEENTKVECSCLFFLKAPEPAKELSSGQKKKGDADFCRDVLGMENEDFEQCWNLESG